MTLSMVVLYSASGQEVDAIVRQLAAAARLRLMIMAQLPPPPRPLVRAPVRRGGAAAHRGGRVRPYRQGAQRWLDLGLQGSSSLRGDESPMLPIMVAAWLSRHSLPPKFSHVTTLVMVLPPTLLITRPSPISVPPSLVAASASSAILPGGISWRLIGLAVLLICAFMPVLCSS